MSFRHFLRALVAALLLVAPALRGEGPETRGHLLLIGGGKRPKAVMERFVELAGGA